jgi:hypothetical protein
MNAEQLLAHYERIADAPDAVARLRSFILDLAVRGKLVPQDLKDERASELLKRIAAKKARLVKAGVIRKSKILPPVQRGDIPVENIPGWTWVRLTDVSTLITKGSTPTSYGHAYTAVHRAAADARAESSIRYAVIDYGFTPPLPFPETGLHPLQLFKVMQEKTNGVTNGNRHRMKEHGKRVRGGGIVGHWSGGDVRGGGVKSSRVLTRDKAIMPFPDYVGN